MGMWMWLERIGGFVWGKAAGFGGGGLTELAWVKGWGTGGVQMSFVEEEKIRQRKGTAAKLP